MAPYRYDRLVRDDEYCQRVRRHRPSSLVPLIAAAAAQYGVPEQPGQWLNSPYRKYTPWALADAARVALAYGTEFHRSDATRDDLTLVLAAYARLKDPGVFGPGDPAERLRDFLLRTAGEQLICQGSEFRALARTAAMYLQTPFPERRNPRYLRTGWDTALFGCSLADYVGIAQLLWASALECAGRFDPSYLDTPDGEQICQVIDRDTILSTLEHHFAIDVPTFRAIELKTKRNLAKTHHGLDAALLRRFTFNPLAGRPAVLGFDSWLLCPAPQYIWRKAGPAGIYHSGLVHFGSGFPEETGYLFEEYIGRHLRLLRHADVVPEISYKVGRNTDHGVDWIVVFDDLVLLIEVKSTMPTEPVRLGIANGLDDIVRKIGKAYQQIDTTADLIARRHPDFADIPVDRPCQGLVVTLEPFHIANAGLPIPGMPQIDIPVTVASAEEVEQWVTLADPGPAALLLERAADPERSTWALHEAMVGHEGQPNPVLQLGWDAYPWAAAHRNLHGDDTDPTSTPIA